MIIPLNNAARRMVLPVGEVSPWEDICMRIGTAMLLAIIAIGLVPAVASATHFDGQPAIDGRCEGWTLDLTVRFRTGTFAADLAYTIELLDADQNVIETVAWTGVVTRPEDSGVYRSFQFTGVWSVDLPAGAYSIRGTATVSLAWSGGFDEDSKTFASGVACEAVATESSTLSGIKSLYR